MHNNNININESSGVELINLENYLSKNFNRAKLESSLIS